MRHTTLHFTCEGCEAPTGHLENDIAEDEADTAMPLGWSQVIIRRVMPNPDYVPAQSAEELAASMTQGMPPAEQQQAIAGLLPMAQMQAQLAAAQVEPIAEVQELEMHFCPQCLATGMLDAEDALVQVEWIAKPAPAPAAPAAPAPFVPTVVEGPEPEPTVIDAEPATDETEPEEAPEPEGAA